MQRNSLIYAFTNNSSSLMYLKLITYLPQTAILFLHFYICNKQHVLS